MMATAPRSDDAYHADYNPLGKHSFWLEHFERPLRHRLLVDDLTAGRIVVAILTAVLALGFVLMAFSVAACI